MNRVLTLLILIALAAAYYVGLVFTIGVLSSIQFPWRPYVGKPALAVYAVAGLEHAFAVAAVASVIAVAVTLRFRTQPFTFGLLAAAPAAFIHAWSVLQASTGVHLSLGFMAAAAQAFVLVLLFPAVLTVVLTRLISNNSFKRM